MIKFAITFSNANIVFVLKWRDLTMITFNIVQGVINFKFPKSFRMETQYSELKWHIPVENNTWLCIDN